MRTVDEGADTIGDTRFDALPVRVQEALGELAGAAKEGLLAQGVAVDLQDGGVVQEAVEAGSGGARSAWYMPVSSPGRSAVTTAAAMQGRLVWRALCRAYEYAVALETLAVWKPNEHARAAVTR